MSKISRILALIMCFTLLLVFMVSCGETDMEKVDGFLESHQPTPDEPLRTLNMYIPCEFDPTTPAAVNVINEMQKEFNMITEEKYNTRVVFKFVESSQYAATLLAQRDYALSQKDTPLKEEQTSVQDKYPKLDDIQLDIFVATSEAMVKDYVNNDAILITDSYGATLTEALDTVWYLQFCKENNATSLAPVIYKNAKENGVRYGIPANFLIGNYTYYAVYKESADKLFFMEEESGNTVAERIAALEKNIADAKAEYTAKDQPLPDWLAPKDEQDNPIEIIKSNIKETELAAYTEDDYYILIQQKPNFTKADYYNGMFCIASTCRYPGKALSVIAELYNNIELHSILQYGAKQITYTLKQVEEVVDGAVVTKTVVAPIINHELGFIYSINPRYTGNITMLYPVEECGSNCTDGCIHHIISGGVPLTSDYLEKVYLQNKDAFFAN